ncbi:MAG: hypothetical protein HC927_08780 [Deltaproteobacteria bacterium]|nr:hypothetical protein [Deltaproteobacteria bacterium]
MEKLLRAIDLPALAFKKYNTFWLDRIAEMEYKPMSGQYLLYHLGLSIQNILCKVGFLGYGVGSIVIFKNVPERSVVAALRKCGYIFKELPRNPYFSRR